MRFKLVLRNQSGGSEVVSRRYEEECRGGVQRKSTPMRRNFAEHAEESSGGKLEPSGGQLKPDERI
jgi:hypothetical protein